MKKNDNQLFYTWKVSNIFYITNDSAYFFAIIQSHLQQLKDLQTLFWWYFERIFFFTILVQCLLKSFKWFAFWNVKGFHKQKTLYHINPVLPYEYRLLFVWWTNTCMFINKNSNAIFLRIWNYKKPSQ